MLIVARILLFITTLSISHQARAQSVPFIQMPHNNAEWTFVDVTYNGANCWIDSGISIIKYATIGDTIFNDTAYFAYGPKGSEEYASVLVREDTSTGYVYIRARNSMSFSFAPELMAMDYNLQIGDTVQSINMFANHEIPPTVVDTIDWVFIEEVLHRRWVFRLQTGMIGDDLTGNPYCIDSSGLLNFDTMPITRYYEWIEGIGGSNDLFSQYYGYTSLAPFNNRRFICYSGPNGEKYTQLPDYVTCDSVLIYLSVDNSSLPRPSLFPNPVNPATQLQLPASLPEGKQKQLLIYSMAGILMYSDTFIANSYPLGQIATWPPGMYILQVVSDSYPLAPIHFILL
jgi:hypothetical protein